MLKTLVTTVAALALLAGTAQADNARVEEALRNRADLSDFYQALVTTGVMRELSPNLPYTVFAPTNDALADISPTQYPCFYATQCREEVAAVLRNHIVPGEAHVTDVVSQKGGVYSIDKRFIRIGEPHRNHYTADGHNILATSMVAGGVVYKIDGLIADERELASFRYPQYVYVPSERVVTTRRSVTDPACGPAGCEAEVSETTTIIHTIPAPLIQYPY